MTAHFKAWSLRTVAAAALATIAFGSAGRAEEITYVSGAVGAAVENFAALVKPWEEALATP